MAELMDPRRRAAAAVFPSIADDTDVRSVLISMLDDQADGPGADANPLPYAEIDRRLTLSTLQPKSLRSSKAHHERRARPTLWNSDSLSAPLTSSETLSKTPEIHQIDVFLDARLGGHERVLPSRDVDAFLDGRSRSHEPVLPSGDVDALLDARGGVHQRVAKYGDDDVVPDARSRGDKREPSTRDVDAVMDARARVTGLPELKSFNAEQRLQLGDAGVLSLAVAAVTPRSTSSRAAFAAALGLSMTAIWFVFR